MQTFHIENMTCGGCVRGVTQAIRSVDPTAEVQANTASRRVDIFSTHSRDVLQEALANVGYQVVDINH